MLNVEQVYTLLRPIVVLIGVGVLMLLPTAAVVWDFYRVRKADDAAAVAPFDELRRRPAGESLRLKLAELDEKIDEWLLLLVATPLVLAYAAAFDRTPTAFLLSAFFLVAAGSAAGAQTRLRPLLRERRQYQLGFQGERYVAEELNQLLADGFDVFHDVPFDNYNIDHVVLGSTGVFVVETKAKRKPVLEGKKRYEVVFDGNALLFPHGRDTAGLNQVRLNVKSLSSWLSSATGDTVRAAGILTVPGWLVTLKGRADVHVLNPKQIRKVVTSHTGTPVDPAMIQRIRHQLEQKCRLSVEGAP